MFRLISLFTILAVILTILFFTIQTSAAPSVPILMYHYIGNNPNPKDLARNTLSVSPGKFEEQMSYLSSHGYTPITLDTLYGIFNHQTSPPPKPIVLTFDDGYIDFYTTAYPILRKYNFHAVSFIPTGLIGGVYYMNWSQIKEIQAGGLVNFEAHSVSHANLPTLSSQKVLQELFNSKNVLGIRIGYPVNFIAYPYGTSNQIVQGLAKKVGFVGGLGTWYSKASSVSFNMPRIRITGGMSLKDFVSKI